MSCKYLVRAVLRSLVALAKGALTHQLKGSAPRRWLGQGGRHAGLLRAIIHLKAISWPARPQASGIIYVCEGKQVSLRMSPEHLAVKAVQLVQTLRAHRAGDDAHDTVLLIQSFPRTELSVILRSIGDHEGVFGRCLRHADANVYLVTHPIFIYIAGAS